jgi:hypothetical protein
VTPNIMSVEQAAGLLQVEEGQLRPWLRSRGLVRTIAGEERVSLRAIEALFEAEFEREDDGLISTEDATRLLGMSRATLDRLAASAPAGLPGGPTNIGSGKRQHFRWDPRSISAWVSAVTAVRSSGRPRRKRRSAPSRQGAEGHVDWKVVARE